MVKTNWYVITGGPSAGKTTVLKMLEEKGYRVVHEAARVYIDKQIVKGKTIEQIRGDEALFQKKVLALKLKKEKSLPKQKRILFDRGIPDSLAYYEVAGLPINDPDLQKAVKNCYYKKIFLLDLLDFEADYARTDAKDAQKIQKLLGKYYRLEGFKVINIPKMANAFERVNFIIDNL